jgi:SusD family/Starch-binding associating with outer membrane
MNPLRITPRLGRRRLCAGAAALLLAAVPACDIDTEPLGMLTTDSFFKTADQAIQATNATYAMLREWRVHVFSWIGLTDIASDDATKGSVPADASFLLDLDNLQFDPGNLAFVDPWSGYYAAIYRANVAIQGISGASIDETLKARLIAENKFLRAYFYFFLVRGWGGVPLITEPLAPSEFAQQRATAEAVWAQIEQDLTDAIAALPERSQYAGADLGRATKGAARALLAEAYLHQGDYANALQQAEAVIGSNEYGLFADYETLFSRAGENSNESVFEVQATALPGGGANQRSAASQYQQVQGVRGTPNIGWGFNNPSAELEDSYEPGDPRLQATIMYAWEQLPDGSGQVVYLNPSMPNNRYNQKVVLPLANPPGSDNGGVNIRRIRYAHVLLTAAEAAARSNREADARTWLNMVRARARGGRTRTLGFYPELLATSIATDVLGRPAGSSRVFVRFVDPSDPAAASVQSFASECVGSCPSGTVPPVRVTNIDIIEAVDGVPVTTLAEYHAQVELKAPGQSVTLTVSRMSQPASGPPTTTPLVVTITAQALLPNVTASGPALLDAIWLERRNELAMEQHRWFDLVRQGPERARLALQAHGKTFVVGRHELFPIPSAEVAISGLQQNPGYGTP